MTFFPFDSTVRGRFSAYFYSRARSISGWSARIDSIIAHPTQLFWVFAGAHLFLWTLIPALVSPNVPLDVIEGYAWGHEWLLGTYKHPPMQAWWLETLADLTDRSSWVHFLASQIAIVIAFWAVWKMGLRIMTGREALVSVLLMDGIVYYNFTSPEFNPNVLQLPFWALIGLFFHRAVKDDKLRDWLLLGIWSACGLYTKYSTGLLLIVLAALLALHPESRRRLREKGPYVAFATMSVLFLPHLIWLVGNHFLPIEYITSRIDNPTAGGRHLAHPLQFLMSQTLALLPMLALLPLLARKNLIFPARNDAPSFDRYFLWAMVFGPMLILLAVSSVGVKVHDMWGTPLWGYVSLWVMSRSHTALTARVLRRFTYGWLTVFLATLIGFGGMNLVSPYLTHKVQRVHFPGQALAEKVDAGWQARVSTPLRYVVGDTWLSGNIAYYTPERPHVFIKGDAKISPWISTSDLKKNGAILVWCVENCGCHDFKEAKPDFMKDYPQAEIQAPLTLKRQTAASVEPVIVGWAILPPAPPTKTLQAAN